MLTPNLEEQFNNIFKLPFGELDKKIVRRQFCGFADLGNQKAKQIKKELDTAFKNHKSRNDIVIDVYHEKQSDRYYAQLTFYTENLTNLKVFFLRYSLREIWSAMNPKPK